MFSTLFTGSFVSPPKGCSIWKNLYSIFYYFHPKILFYVQKNCYFCYRNFLWNLWLQPKLTSFCKINHIALLPLMSNNHSVAWFFLGVAFFYFIYVLDTQVVIHNMNAFIGSIDVWKTVPLETQGLYMNWSPILNI